MIRTRPSSGRTMKTAGVPAGKLTMAARPEQHPSARRAFAAAAGLRRRVDRSERELIEVVRAVGLDEHALQR